MNLFNDSDRSAIERRLAALTPSSARQWGKMDAAQMLAHLVTTMEMACGERPMKQAFIGRILGPFVRKRMLGDVPFGKNSPTHPDFRIADPREFAKERDRLQALIRRFHERGPAAAGDVTHAFLGRCTGDEWGRLMGKHIDHHLRQFSA
jgi:hypothetical protein